MSLMISFIASGSLANISATIGVLIVPGHTALMQIPLEAYSSAAPLRQSDHSVLGCMVGCPAGDADQTANRRVVDDGAASLLAHLAQLVLHAVPDAAQIDRVNVLELFVADISHFQGR